MELCLALHCKEEHSCQEVWDHSEASQREMQENQPLHRKVEQYLQKFYGIQVVSAVDMSNGFGVLPIVEEDQHYFAFMTPNHGSWAFKR